MCIVVLGRPAFRLDLSAPLGSNVLKRAHIALHS
jgi:hypothetical protein